jgi:probable rRNA maturation factor
MNKMGFYNTTPEDLKRSLKKMQSVLKYTLRNEHIHNAVFNVIIVDNQKIQDLNKQYRHIDAPTDVITFALEDDPMINPTKKRLLGDIYISIDKVQGQALEYGHSELREIIFLSVHGLLHLLGYDHITKQEEKIMFAKQTEVLNKYGIKR